MRKTPLVALLLLLMVGLTLLPTASADTETLRPNAAGTYQEWDVSDTTHYGATSDQSDATYIYTSVEGETDTQHLADPTGTGTINSVTVWIRAVISGGAAAPESACVLIRTYGTDYEGAAQTISRTAFTDYSETYTTNPYTGSAWTWTEVTDLEAGGRVKKIGATEEIRVSEIWVVVDYTPPSVNNPPTNDQCSITDMDDGDNIYAQKRDYTIDYDVSDLDGYADIDYAEVRLKQGTLLRATFRYDEDTDTFTIETNSTQWTLNAGASSAVESGNSINITFAFSAQWDAVEEADLEIECYVVDDEPASDTDVMQTDYVDVVTDLLISGFSCDDDRGDLGQSLTFTGTVYYASDPGSSTPSASYPPDAEFTAVLIHNSTHHEVGSDATVVDGAFSAAVTAESTVGLETYHANIDMADADYPDGDESPTDTFIADQMDIILIDDDTVDRRIDVGSTFEIRYNVTYDYDDVLFDDTKGSIVGFTWDSVNRWWDKAVTASSLVESTNYDETYVTINDTTYGITVKQDVAGVDIITDRINIYWWQTNDTRLDLDIAAEIRVRLVLDYDEHPLGAGDTAAINGTAASWDDVNLWFEIADTSSTVTAKLYSVSSAEEATYGITAVYHNVTRPTVIWDRIQVSFTVDNTSPSNGETVTFTVTLTYEYDGAALTDYAYDVNRNGTLFVDDHTTSTFTDSNSDVTYVYDFVDVVDNTYGLQGFVDPPDLTVTWSENPDEYATKGFVLATVATAAFLGVMIALPVVLLTGRRRR